MPLSAANGPLTPGFGPGVHGETLTQTFQIAGLDGPWLPAAFSPVRFDGVDGVSFNARDSSLVIPPGTSTNGLEYSVDSLIPRYDPASLRAADAAPTGLLAQEHLALPDDFPAELAELARSVTAGATTRYDQAIALQSWFRGFDYDESLSAGTSQDAMVEFVAEGAATASSSPAPSPPSPGCSGCRHGSRSGSPPASKPSTAATTCAASTPTPGRRFTSRASAGCRSSPPPGGGIIAAEPYTGVPAAQSGGGGSPITSTSAPP